MYAELGIEPSALSVARHYGSLLSGFVLDRQDAGLAQEVNDLGIETKVTDSIMNTPQDRLRLAEEVLEFGESLVEDQRSDD